MRVFVGVTVFAPGGIRCIDRKESKSKPLDKEDDVLASTLAVVVYDAVIDDELAATELDDEEELSLATIDVEVLLDFLGLDVVVVAVFLLRTGKLPESIL